MSNDRIHFIQIGEEDCSVGTITEEVEESFGIKELVLIQANGFNCEKGQVTKGPNLY